MSAEQKQTEPNIRLIHPYTFDECAFAFTDPRTERKIALFGAVEITQNHAETIGLDGAFSSAAAYHTTLAEAVALATTSAPAEVPPHIVMVQVGAKDVVRVAEKEPICVEFVEQVSLATGTLHAQHGHIYINFTEQIGVSSVLLPPLHSVLTESLGFAGAPQEGTAPFSVPTVNITAQVERRQKLSFILYDGGSLQDFQGQVFTAHRSFTSGGSLREAAKRDLHLCRSFAEKIGIHSGILPQPHSLFVEQIGFSPVRIPPLVSCFSECISIRDGILRASEASLSGFTVGHSMTLAEFKSRLVHPVGYETFRPFHVGEYEYERALVRISMKAGSLGAIPQIYDVVMNVDIDDTVDRGTARVEAKETEIPYHKHYYTKPEVTVTLQRGNTGDGVLTPEITMIGTDFFRCILHKRDGTAATGTVSWTAVGY